MAWAFNPFTGNLDYYVTGSAATWGSITGTLSSQTDLQTALNAKKTDSMSTNKLLGRGTAGTGVIEEITLGTNLSLSGNTLNATGGSGSAPADQANYIFSSTTTAADPGATYFRLNYNIAEPVTTKVLTGNVATLTTTNTHGYAIGDYVYVNIGDATFDGWQTITAVNAGAKTFSFAKTAASIASTATSGTAFNVTKITELYIDTLGVSSTDYTEWLKQINAGDTLVLANTTTSSKWLRFRVRQVPTDNTGWYTIKIQWTGGTLPPANNDAITFIGEHSPSGQMLVYQNTAGTPWTVPPTTFGSDGDWCMVLPGTGNIYKNYGARFIQKTNGSWQPANNTTPSTLLNPQYIIPSMGQSVAPAPITGQGVSAPIGSGSNIVPSDWYVNSGSPTPTLKFSQYPVAPTPGAKVSIGKGLGSFGIENMAFFGGSGSIGQMPMDIDTIKMKFSTNTAATDPGTEYIKVNNATASSVTQVYCSELGYTRTVTNKALTSGVATLTTSAAHSYFVGQQVTVTGVDSTFNGTYTLTAVASTTLSYSKKYTVTNKALTSNVATLTIGTHGMLVGESITISSVDATFNGTYTLTAVGATTISYAKTASDVVSTSATGTAAWADVASVASGGSVNADLSQQFTYGAVATPPAYTDQAPFMIKITQDSDATKFIHIWKSAAATDNGTWRTVPATFAQVGAGGLPINNADVTVTFYYNNAMWIANGYGESQYGIGVCVRGDGNVSLRGVADRGVFSSKGSTEYITNTVLTSNVATLTTSRAHGFAIGDSVTVTNCTNTTYNGTYTITAVTSTTFSYALVTANIGSAASIGEACNGAKTSDYIYVEKYINRFQAYLVRNNAQVYAIPAATATPFLLTQLLAYDDLLGTQGVMFTTTSRDGYIASLRFTF